MDAECLKQRKVLLNPQKRARREDHPQLSVEAVLRKSLSAWWSWGSKADGLPSVWSDTHGDVDQNLLRILPRSEKLVRFASLLLYLAWIHSAAFAADAPPIIDVHLHVYDDSQLPMPQHPTYPGEIRSVPDQSTLIAETLAQMDKHNIVLGLLHDTPANIEKLRERAPDRFLAYPRIGGRFQGGTMSQDPAPEEFERAIGRGDWAGIGEIATVYNGLDPTDTRLWPYYQLANRLDIPVAWHTGTRRGMTLTQPEFRAEIGRPTRWEDIFSKLPNLRAVLFHAGHPFRDDFIAVMMTYPWVYTDTGPFGHVRTPQQFYAYFGYLIEMGLGDRIMFGSDQMGWPEGIGRSVRVIEEAPWDESIKRKILYNNAARFLRLSKDQIEKHHRR